MAKPDRVRRAQHENDTKALSRMGRAGGIASAKKREERRILKEVIKEDRRREADEMAAERQDHLLPEEH